MAKKKDYSEYRAGEPMCWNCYWWEYKDVFKDNYGRCRLKYAVRKYCEAERNKK